MEDQARRELERRIRQGGSHVGQVSGASPKIFYSSEVRFACVKMETKMATWSPYIVTSAASCSPTYWLEFLRPAKLVQGFVVCGRWIETASRKRSKSEVKRKSGSAGRRGCVDGGGKFSDTVLATSWRCILLSTAF